MKINVYTCNVSVLIVISRLNDVQSIEMLQYFNFYIFYRYK